MIRQAKEFESRLRDRGYKAQRGGRTVCWVQEEEELPIYPDGYGDD